MSMKEQKPSLNTPEGHMNAFLVSPETRAGGKISAVIVIQEAFGVNHHMQEVCRRVAALGYVAISPELFHRQGAGLDLPYGDFSKVMPVLSKLTNAGIRSDIDATLKYLATELKIPAANVAVMGFCLGGLAAMIAATGLPIGAAISYYGGGMTESREGMGLSPVIQDFGKIHCPVLLFFGGKDQSIPMSQILEVETALKAQHKKYELTVYPEAGHAFTNDERPTNYNEAATKASWAKTVSWLKEVSGQ